LDRGLIMALSGTITGTTNNQWIDCKIEWTATQSVSGNYSEITAVLYYIRTNTGYTTHGNLRGSITINGEKTSTVNEIWITETHWEEASRVKTKVYHNSDGTKSTTISATGYINNTSLDSTSISGTITLDQIHRKAYITSAENFTDEGNPKITYENPAGSGLDSLQACISFDGDIDIPYRDVSKTSGTYTFNLTEAERKILRQGTTGKSRTVRFYLKSIAGSEVVYTHIEKTLTIVNGNPTITAVIKDTNSMATLFTGDENILVRYISNASVNMTITPKKEATITSKKVVNGSKVLTDNGIIEDVENNTFTFTATDSRGFTTTTTTVKPMINYIRLTCNLSDYPMDTDGNYKIDITGNYFNGSFGRANNHINLYYRFRSEDSEFGNWTQGTPTITNNTYKLSLSMSGLDYLKTYYFEAYAEDAMSVVYSVERVVRAVPVFDWDKNDFTFNVPVSFKSGFTKPNKLLWQGQVYMNETQTINLGSKISTQANGIVLVFSNYDSTTGTANNYDWHCFFVPKGLVSLHGGTGHTFNMMSQAFGDIASKYLYISDASISGNEVNTTNGTRNGITYNNAKYVLRYVIGV